MNRRTFILSAMAGLAVSALPATAAKLNLSDGNLAIKGYDPVAYFTANKETKGSAEFTATHEGATYRFASAENRDAFAANPGRYAPAYGGFCAYAVSQGYVAPIDPAAFSVVDDRLYLNFSKGVRSKWEKDIPGHIKAANANWPGLSAN